jgi:hypothetical protein
MECAMNLFDYRDAYPFAPGYAPTDTSYAAAKAIESETSRLQRKSLAAIVAAGDQGLTMEQVADAIGEHRHSVQPRTSELRAKGLICDSGIRRTLASGRKGIAWIATSKSAT